MATGFRIMSNDDFARWVDRYRRHPSLESSYFAIIVGVIAGTTRSWWVGAVGGLVTFVVFRFVVGRYASHMSQSRTTRKEEWDDGAC